MDTFSLSPHSCPECQVILIDGTGPNVEQRFEFLHCAVEESSPRCKFFSWALKLPDVPLHTTAKLVLSISQKSEDLKCLDVVWKGGNNRPVSNNKQQKLYIFIGEDECAAQYITSRPLAESPGSSASLKKCLEFYKSCLGHEKCRAAIEENNSKMTPTRLLDVRSNSQLRLYTVPRGKNPLYAALSYCWGTSQQQIDSRTTRVNIQDRHGGIDICELTQSIRDAIEVTRRLELSYLWVDALCIIQDDIADFASEVSRMRSIYRGASVTISAASAKDSTEGFLGDRDLENAYGNLFQIRYHNNHAGDIGQGLVLLSEHPVTDTYQENIDERAWALQEDILSLRLLRFGSKQTTWRCPTHHPARRIDGGGFQVEYDKDIAFSVDDPYRKAEVQSNILDFGSIGIPYINAEWLRVVSRYTCRKLTRQADRLAACAALAENYADIMGLDASNYLAGLWKNDIYAQLLWYRPEGIVVERTSGPSWSWMSINGPVQFFPRRLLAEDLIVNSPVKYVSSYMDDISSKHNYSDIGSGRLELNGRLQRAYWDSLSLRRGINDADILPLKIYWDVSHGLIPQSVWCLEVISSYFSLGLVLVMKDHTSFKRVGFFECIWKEDKGIMKSFFGETESQNIVLY